VYKFNEDIKQIKGDIPAWVISRKLGIHENTYFRWVRQELDPTTKAKILNAINEIKQEIKEHESSEKIQEAK